MSFKKSIICDKNRNLMNFWKIIKSGSIDKLIKEIKFIETNFNKLSSLLEKEAFYYEIRNMYNNSTDKKLNKYKIASYFIFLNKAGYNGLYRENTNGKYNVPFGKKLYLNLVNNDNLYQLKSKLKNTIILCGDFSKVKKYILKYNFDLKKTFFI